ncbi:glucose oxidase [Xylariales sp. PMI_506]|nr:glucose oxidase [Xylariales sp. PMI_506]
MKTSVRLLLLAITALARSETADFVIVGGGTSGLVIANRLSEIPNVRVTVIEAGDDVRNNPNVTNPNQGLYITPSIDWAYVSTPQTQIGNQTLVYHAGKAIGGTSVINGKEYIRGDKAEFDAWETLGNKGWNWDALFPYFKKSENFTIPTTAQIAAGATYVPGYHGEEGYLKTGYLYALTNTSLYEDSVQSWTALGIPSNPDLEGGTTHGFNVYPSTIDRDANVREDAARAYYQPVEFRHNLSVVKGMVTKLTWAKDSSGEGVVANGVEYLDASGTLQSISVTKDVIVSAGTYKSPLVLEASGIGNPKILGPLGIETVVDLPGVGESMQDQPINSLAWTSTENITGQAAPYVIMTTAQDLFGDNFAALNASTSSSLAAWAQQLASAGAGGISEAALEARFRVQHDLIFGTDITIAEVGVTINEGLLVASFWDLLPFSWGSAHLGGGGAPDASGEPLIDPNFLDVAFDVDVIIAAGNLTLTVFNTAPLSSWTADYLVPGDAALPAFNATQAQWDTFVYSDTGATWHAIGTCSMLPQDLGGVVDSRLKVYGTQNVRVMDASIIPLQMSGHPTATLYAVAERAAELIKEDWSY